MHDNQAAKLQVRMQYMCNGSEILASPVMQEHDGQMAVYVQSMSIRGR